MCARICGGRSWKASRGLKKEGLRWVCVHQNWKWWEIFAKNLFHDFPAKFSKAKGANPHHPPPHHIPKTLQRYWITTPTAPYPHHTANPTITFRPTTPKTKWTEAVLSATFPILPQYPNPTQPPSNHNQIPNSTIPHHTQHCHPLLKSKTNTATGPNQLSSPI